GTPDVKASITIVDAAGNTASDSDTESFLVDKIGRAACRDEARSGRGEDNYQKEAELDDKVSVTLQGTVRGDAKVGDTVTLTLPDGSTITTSAVGRGGGTLGRNRTTAVDHLGTGTPDVKASITIVDAAGNTASDSDTESFLVD